MMNMADLDKLKEEIAESSKKSAEFRSAKRETFTAAFKYGVFAALIFAGELFRLDLTHDEPLFQQASADYESGQLVVPDDFVQDKVLTCTEDVYEDEFEDQTGIDYDDLSRESLEEIVMDNYSSFASCSFNKLAASDEVKEDYVDSLDYKWSGFLYFWGGGAGFFTALGVTAWNRQRKYDAVAKNKTLDLKLLE
tara:strand:+ start:121 stop:702 length:582 start_codon:yes stop_codon:yes gene_type:complete